MTLIEVVLGLLVLSVLVGALIVSRGRFTRQHAQAQAKLAATRAADRLLAGWIGGQGEDAIPVPAQGILEGVDGGAWRTTWVARPAAQRLGAAVVRFEALQDGKRIFAVEVLKQIRGRSTREPQP